MIPAQDPNQPHDQQQHDPNQMAQMSEMNEKLQELSEKETEELVKSFQDHFNDCTKACKKPNILVAGITGAGKSSLVNAVFGEELARAGAGMPVTQHFQKYEPNDKPVVIYDSKGLEWNSHEEFIKETGKFFMELRQSPDVANHIHVVWYVVNTARGRFENFEAEVVREVFAPTPVIFVLNKSDLADSLQLKAIKKVIEDEKLEHNKGIHVCISKRENWTQSWCPDCLSDDVFYDEETKQLECSDCGFNCILKESYGMKKLINHTCELLPELARDAFMYSQIASMAEKDRRAKEIVIEYTKEITIDAKGTFIKKIAEMCAKLFVIWGWPLTGDTFKNGLSDMQREYMSQLNFKERYAAVAVDKLFGSRLSKAFSGVIGLTMNRGMKKLNQQLIEKCAKGELKDMKMDDFIKESDLTEDFIKFFFETAITQGVETALDKLWDLSSEELVQLMSQMDFQHTGLFGHVNFEEAANMEQIEQLMQNVEDVSISEVDVELKEEDEEKAPLVQQSSDSSSEQNKKSDEEEQPPVD
ncbi:hypothetical protein C9374_009653 [Naegleria lovaniensis]|uniref:G domain-containing protein n=1 Tax=Naegleria lovaniensis TaxID=51637 RepID=A0AA88H381_NAELO|nr:uncharacterized protein C9374_009653 [Naegleria lovaniensis]KAG2393076.1 hypothetical protein C9374_009653 [Naegleria lovaniensis]